MLETVFETKVSETIPNPSTLSPSELGGAKALPGDAGENTDAAKRYGSLVHLLLENEGRAPQMVSEPETLARAQAEADAVLKDPSLQHVFAPETLAEVSLSADIGAHRLHGTIDRLVINADHILAIDFKSNRVVPDRPESCPDGLLRQMGAYALMLRQIYPTHRIETAILWTAPRQLMMLPHEIVSSAAQKALELDVGVQRS